MPEEAASLGVSYNLGERLWDIVVAPINNPEMLWLVIPLLLALVVFEFYFGGHRKEELGWNSAVANSLLLVFVSLALLRVIYSDLSPIEVYHAIRGGIESQGFWGDATMQTLVALFVLAEGAFLFLTNFFHMWPKEIAFKISSALPVNLTAYMATVLVFSHQTSKPIPLDWLTLVAAIVLLIALLLAFGVVHLIERIFA